MLGKIVVVCLGLVVTFLCLGVFAQEGRHQVDKDTIVTEAATEEQLMEHHSRTKRQALSYPAFVQQRSPLLGQWQQTVYPQSPMQQQQQPQRMIVQQQRVPVVQHQQQSQHQQMAPIMQQQIRHPIVQQRQQRAPIFQRPQQQVPVQQVTVPQPQRIQQGTGARFPRAHQQPSAPAQLSDGNCQNSRGETGQCVSLAECFPYIGINNQATIDLLVKISTPCTSDSGPNAIFTQNQGSRPSQPQFFQTQTICCTGSRSSGSKPVPVPSPIPTPASPAVVYPPARHEIADRKWDKSVLPAHLRHLVPPNVSPVPIEKYPWTVAIMNGDRHHCGGSLISRYTIITAAHCIYNLDSYAVTNLRVLLGHHDISSGARHAAVTRRVIKTIYHSQFSMRTLHNDIGLLILDQPVPTETLKISTAKLSSGPDMSGSCTIAGWGQLGWTLPQTPTLMETTIDIWNNRKCASLYGPLAPGGITGNMICGSAAGKDACRGDSGGPLMTKKVNGYELIGIVSWGIECGRYPSVHTRISSYLPWIQKNRID